MKALRFVFLSLAVFFGIIYLMVVSYVYFNQEEMIFPAYKLPQNYQFSFDEDFKEMNIPSFDGKKLNGLLFKVKNPKGLIFYLHGNAGALNSWGNVAKVYTQLGYDVFILDYRGYGKSEGTIENQEQMFQDVSIVYHKLMERYDEKNVFITGYSIGTGIAAYLASENNPKGLILLAPYDNFTEFSGTRMPFIPNFIKKFSFETNQYIKKIQSPIAIFHGNKDNVISFDNSVRLAKLLKKGSQFYLLENQDHIGINENEAYITQLKQILAN